jgi:hypothetical protein
MLQKLTLTGQIWPPGRKLPPLALDQCFSTFFGSRHPSELKNFLAAPFWVKNDQFVALYVVKYQKIGSNSRFGGTPDTFLRHPGWESLH